MKEGGGTRCEVWDCDTVETDVVEGFGARCFEGGGGRDELELAVAYVLQAS